MNTNNSGFKYTIDNEFGDNVIEEKANTSLNLRKISWGDKEDNFKLDIRKWYYKDGEEICGKGVTLSEEGGHCLAEMLVEKGYGDTRKIIDSLKTRDDFDESLLDKSIEDDGDVDTDYYDPKELLSA